MTLPSPRLPWSSTVEQAVRWLIQTPGVTYSQAARRYQVTVNNLRARVEYRYGSLALAREVGADEEDTPLVLRRCIVCRRHEEMEEFQRICNACGRLARIKDGGLI